MVGRGGEQVQCVGSELQGTHHLGGGGHAGEDRNAVTMARADHFFVQPGGHEKAGPRVDGHPRRGGVEDGARSDERVLTDLAGQCGDDLQGERCRQRYFQRADAPGDEGVRGGRRLVVAVGTDHGEDPLRQSGSGDLPSVHGSSSPFVGSPTRRADSETTRGRARGGDFVHARGRAPLPPLDPLARPYVASDLNRTGRHRHRPPVGAFCGHAAVAAAPWERSPLRTALPSAGQQP